MRWQETGREHLLKGDSVDTVRSMVATTSDSTVTVFLMVNFATFNIVAKNNFNWFRMKAAMKASLKFQHPEGTL